MIRRWFLPLAVAVLPPFSALHQPLPADTLELRPAVTVLLEDLHNQSRTEDKGNFGQGKLREVLEKNGAVVSSTLDLLASAQGSQRKLTLGFLSRFDLVISNGRYRGTMPCNSADPEVIKNWHPPAIVDLFSTEEIKALDEYVKDGGIFFVTSGGATLGFGIEPPLYNPLLKEFGVEIAMDEFKGSREVPAAKGANHPLTRELPVMQPTFPTTLLVTSREAKTLYSRDGRPMMVLINRGKGALIVAGGGSGWMNQGIEKSAASCPEPNKRFLKNLVEWAGQRDVQAKVPALAP